MDSTKCSVLMGLLTTGLLISATVSAQGSAYLTVTGSLVEKKIFNVDQLKQLPQKEVAESRGVELDGFAKPSGSSIVVHYYAT